MIQSRNQITHALFSLTLGVIGSVGANSDPPGLLRDPELGFLCRRPSQKANYCNQAITLIKTVREGGL